MNAHSVAGTSLTVTLALSAYDGGDEGVRASEAGRAYNYFAGHQFYNVRITD